MACITIANISCIYIHNTIEDGDKHTVYRFLTQDLISCTQTFTSFQSFEPERTYKSTTYCHIQSCRNSLTAHISDSKSEVSFVHTEEIIEITTNILSSIHKC